MSSCNRFYLYSKTLILISSHSQSFRCCTSWKLKKIILSHFTEILSIYFSHAERKIQNKISDNYKIRIYWYIYSQNFCIFCIVRTDNKRKNDNLIMVWFNFLLIKILNPSKMLQLSFNAKIKTLSLWWGPGQNNAYPA